MFIQQKKRPSEHITLKQRYMSDVCLMGQCGTDTLFQEYPLSLSERVYDPKWLDTNVELTATAVSLIYHYGT